MLEQLLSKLPYILTFWTSALLCWGLYISALILKSFKQTITPEIRALRRFHLGCTLVANGALFFYLLFEPQLAKSCGDAIVVIDVFYTSSLIFMSAAVRQWFNP